MPNRTANHRVSLAAAGGAIAERAMGARASASIARAGIIGTPFADR
jgi:hypothetical protein